MSDSLIRIDMNEGVMLTLWNDDMSLEGFGALRVTRASNVEFDDDAQAWFVALPSGEKIAAGFARRADALAWEVSWANDQIRSGAA
jgi:hypothetical protein